jgi:hypothetical protein
MAPVWSSVSSVLSCRQRSIASSPILVRVSTARLVQKSWRHICGQQMFGATYVATVMSLSLSLSLSLINHGVVERICGGRILAKKSSVSPVNEAR